MKSLQKFCSAMILPIWIAAGAAIGVVLDAPVTSSVQ